jgi:hypothetical protein
LGAGVVGAIRVWGGAYLRVLGSVGRAEKRQGSGFSGPARRFGFVRWKEETLAGRSGNRPQGRLPEGEEGPEVLGGMRLCWSQEVESGCSLTVSAFLRRSSHLAGAKGQLRSSGMGGFSGWR